MNTKLSRLLVPFFTAFLFVSLFSGPSRAELVGTGRVAAPQPSERERVKSLIARPEVAQRLEALGVLPKDAQARVDALTDAEVVALAGRIDALPAGGLGTTEWLLIIIAVILLIIAL